jgi:glycosyltransferase involved in cell wall biosynthesis
MMRVQVIAKSGNSATGIGRYTDDLTLGLRESGLDVTRTDPNPPPRWMVGAFKRLGYDLDAFLKSYPFSAPRSDADVVHIAGQTMATLLWIGRFNAPVVVTVHDIIPYIVRHDPSLRMLRHRADAALYRLALAGLRKADAIITVSAYVRQTLIDHLGLSEARIFPIHNPISLTRFHPLPVPDDFRSRYGLDAGRRYLMFIGSEDPRKNFIGLLRAFAQVRERMPEVVLIKVGRAHVNDQRDQALRLIAEMGIGDSVRFLEDIPDADLPLLYNAVDALVMPSLYEGFGYPPLEAMACGTPALASETTSLGEIVGDAALTVDPTDVDAIAAALIRLLTDEGLRDVLRARGLQHVQRFGMDTFIGQVQAVYAQMVRRVARGA